jgi:hypothetical protein
MGVEYKYQIILLGKYEEIKETIVNLFFEKIAELNLQKDFYKIILSHEVEEQYKGNQPVFTLYFGEKVDEFIDVDIVTKLLKEGNTVLPIYYNSFEVEIPRVLGNQNGLKWNDSQNERVVNLILESFGKLRNTRKVFISYRRCESTSVAIQLYEALERCNFDVFLDTHSIKQGEPFQDELWHRMADCDVIILLNTPEFLESGWCEKEIAEASAKQIGVLQLVWPTHKLARMAELCFLQGLKEEDFVNHIYSDKDKSKLEEDIVEDIVRKVESIRARNLAARQDNLITEFLNLAKKNGKEVSIQPERFITEDLLGKKKRIFIPSVGIPQSTDYNQSSELKKEINEYSVEDIYLIYDNIRIREKWLHHLDYLNEYLDVKTIKKQDFDIWLKEN